MAYEDKARQFADEAGSMRDQARDRLAAAGETIRDEAQKAGRSLSETATELAETASAKLRSAGVDPDHMMDAARGQASELQRMIAAEVRARPLRALGVAALVGLAFGLLTSR